MTTEQILEIAVTVLAIIVCLADFVFLAYRAKKDWFDACGLEKLAFVLLPFLAIIAATLMTIALVQYVQMI